MINRIRLNASDYKANPEPIKVLAVTGAPARSTGKFNAIDSVRDLTDGILHKPVRLEALAQEIHDLITVTA